MYDDQSPHRGMFLRAVFWLFASEVRVVLAISVAFLVYMLLKHFGFATGGARGVDVELFISLFIFGVFFGVVVVTDGAKKYKKNGGVLRAVCGAVAGLSIGLIYSASGEVLFLMAIAGAMLGTFGRRLFDGL